MSKKPKKKYNNNKFHFIVFQTAKKPINLSISKWIVYSSASILIISIIFVSVFAFRVYNENNALNNDLSTVETELKAIKVDKAELGEENSNLKDTLSQKTVEIEETLTELEVLQDSIKQIKEKVGIVVAENTQDKTSNVVAQEMSVQPMGNTSRGRAVTPMENYNIELYSLGNTHMDEKIELIDQIMSSTREEVESLQITVEDREQYLRDVPLRFPAAGRITSKYGRRWGGFHRGIDIANNIGTNIYASGNGKVIESGYGYSYGNYILVQHKHGFETRYAHLSKRYVEVGESVEQGQKIGAMGNTGTSYGSHLHYEIYYNNYLINPLTIDEYLVYKE